jgi:hypothetical protein
MAIIIQPSGVILLSKLGARTARIIAQARATDVRGAVARRG